MIQDRLWRAVPGRKSAISRRLDASCYGVKYLRRTHDRVGDDTLRATITRHRGYTVKRFHALMRQMERAKCSLIIGVSGRECTKSDNYRYNFSLVNLDIVCMIPLVVQALREK